MRAKPRFPAAFRTAIHAKHSMKSTPKPGVMLNDEDSLRAQQEMLERHLAKMLPGEGDGGSPGFSAAGSLMFPAGAALRAKFCRGEDRG